MTTETLYTHPVSKLQVRWGGLGLVHQVAADYERALSEATSLKDRERVKELGRKNAAKAASVPVAKITTVTVRMRRCTYCGARTTSALCCGDETVAS